MAKYYCDYCEKCGKETTHQKRLDKKHAANHSSRDLYDCLECKYWNGRK